MITSFEFFWLLQLVGRLLKVIIRLAKEGRLIRYVFET
jgi:hypothetical protein